MADLISKNTRNEGGPWLLDKAALLKLSDLLEEQWGEIHSRRQKDVENAKRRELKALRSEARFAGWNEERKAKEEKAVKDRVEDRWEFREKRSIIIRFSDGSHTNAVTLKEVVESGKFDDRFPTAVEVEMESAKREIKFAVKRAEFLYDFELAVHPAADSTAVDVFGRISSWANDHRPDWQWRALGLSVFLRWFLAFVLMYFVYLYFSALAIQARDSSVKAEARQMLHRGLKPEDQPRAIELLLAIESGYSPTHESGDPYLWRFLWCAGVIITVTLIFSYRVRTTFGIGRGEAAIKWHQRYRRWVMGVLLGTIVFGGVVRAIQSAGLEALKSLF